MYNTWLAVFVGLYNIYFLGNEGGVKKTMETLNNIKIDEGGYQAEVYLCTAGKRTWLYGRNIEGRPITLDEWDLLKKILKMGGTQKDWAELLFEKEMNEINRYFRFKTPYYEHLPYSVKNVVINMAYNMGVAKFNHRRWPNFFKALRDKDWVSAAKHGRDSKWYKQVGERSKRLMHSLESV